MQILQRFKYAVFDNLQNITELSRSMCRFCLTNVHKRESIQFWRGFTTRSPFYCWGLSQHYIIAKLNMVDGVSKFGKFETDYLKWREIQLKVLFEDARYAFDTDEWVSLKKNKACYNFCICVWTTRVHTNISIKHSTLEDVLQLIK